MTKPVQQLREEHSQNGQCADCSMGLDCDEAMTLDLLRHAVAAVRERGWDTSNLFAGIGL